MSSAGRRRPTRRGTAGPQDRGGRRAFDGRRLWYFTRWSILILLVLFAAYQGHYIIFRASYFKLKKLTIVGLRDIPREQVVAMSGLELGMPVFRIDTRAVARRLKLLPRIARLDIRKNGPNEVVISIVEKKPAARVLVDGEAYEVGRGGAILGKARKRDSDLPWVLGATVLPAAGGLGLRLDPRIVDGLVEWLPVLERSPLADFSGISFPVRGKVVVMWHDIEFFLADKKLFQRHCRDIPALLELERETNRRLLYLDFRFSDIVARFHPVE